MTVIAAAVADDGQIVMAADTGSTGNGNKYAARPKIQRRKHVLLGCAGYAAMDPALRHVPLPKSKGLDLDEWAQQCAEHVTAALVGHRYPRLLTDEGIPGELLLGYAGRLWYLEASLSTPCPEGVAAVGSGADVAYGAMRAALAAGVDPWEATINAVRYACDRDAGCNLTGGQPQVEVL